MNFLYLLRYINFNKYYKWKEEMYLSHLFVLERIKATDLELLMDSNTVDLYVGGYNVYAFQRSSNNSIWGIYIMNLIK